MHNPRFAIALDHVFSVAAEVPHQIHQSVML